MPRKYRIAAVLLLAAAFLGYRYYAAHRVPQADAGKVASHAAVNTPPAAPRMLGSIAFKPCTLAAPMGAANVEAQCGKLAVAENPALPQGRRIELNIAWIPSDEDGADAPDPVFMLAGGPGQSATEGYPAIAPAFRDVTKDRSVILVDQRGTGKSHPLLCKGLDGLDDGSAALDEAAMLQALRTATQRCRDALSKKADLRFYTTTDAVRDLDAVRQAIGADKIDLLGISYGTRVAQHYAMQHPDRTRALVLDSVAPNDIYLGNDFARNLESALDLQFGRCGQTPGCKAALGDPRQRLDTLMAKLKSDPPQVTYRDASTARTRTETLWPGNVVALARMYAYMPAAASLLPLLFDQADKGHYAELMALSKMLVVNIGDQMAMGMQLSVICSEDVDGLKPDPAMADSLLGNALVTGLQAQCAVWPKGTRPAGFHQPFAGKTPTLVLSGELDPVTPPAYAKRVVATLPNGRMLELRGQGHNVIGAGCMPKLFAQFLQDANAKSLDTKCLDTLAYTPPFTDFNGWGP